MYKTSGNDLQLYLHTQKQELEELDIYEDRCTRHG